MAGFVLWHSSRPCYRTPWFSITSYHDVCYLTNSSVDFVPGNRYLVTLQTCWRFLCASTVRHDTISTNQKSVRLLFWTTQKRAIYTGKFGHAIITLSSTGNGWIWRVRTILHPVDTRTHWQDQKFEFCTVGKGTVKTPFWNTVVELENIPVNKRY